MRQWLHEIYNYTLNTCRCRVSFIHWWSKNIKSWGKDSKISTSKRDSTFSIVTKILLNFRVGSALVSWASNSCWSKHGNKPNKAFLIFGWQDLTFWSDISSWSVSGARIWEEGFSKKKQYICQKREWVRKHHLHTLGWTCLVHFWWRMVRRKSKDMVLCIDVCQTGPYTQRLYKLSMHWFLYLGFEKICRVMLG